MWNSTLRKYVPDFILRIQKCCQCYMVSKKNVKNFVLVNRISLSIFSQDDKILVVNENNCL
jgi:hypothetical protein